MIALAKEFLHSARVATKMVLPISDPPRSRIYTGSSVEKIDAVIGADDRIEELIIHTRTRSGINGVRVFTC